MKPAAPSWRRRVLAALTLATTLAVPGVARAAIAYGDFNRDGFVDVAFGVPDEDLKFVTDAGGVDVVYASASGLTVPLRSESWNQDSVQGGIGVADTAEAYDHFGAALSAGDFDGDGYDDLAIAVPDEDFVEAVKNCVFCPVTSNAGAVHILYGSPAGLTTAGNQLLTQNPPLGGGILDDQREPGDRFGGSLASGRFHGAACADLAVGAPGEDGNAGAVTIVYCSEAGLSGAGSHTWRQGRDGLAEVAEANDAFGQALASGDFDRDGYGDLAVGVPSEDYLRLSPTGEPMLPAQDAGGVHVLYGSLFGITSLDSEFLRQGGVFAAGTALPAAAGSGDHLGAALAVGNLSVGEKFPTHDLVIGAPHDEGGAGLVHVVYGTSQGLDASAASANTWRPGALGLGTPADGAFGSALATGDFNGDSRIDLAVGAPGKTLFSVRAAGAVVVIRAADSGLSTTGAQVIGEASFLGSAARSETDDRFGAVLASADFDRSGPADLLVGVPFEDVSVTSDAGAVDLLQGSPTGLSRITILTQGAAGVPGAAESGDHFGG